MKTNSFIIVITFFAISCTTTGAIDKTRLTDKGKEPGSSFVIMKNGEKK